jgi:PAS domain S-box-containing protein
MNGAPRPSPPSPTHRSPLAAAVAFVGVLALAASDWYFGLTFNSAILYSSLLLICWWYRSIRLVWTLAGVMIVATVVGGFVEPTDLRSSLHRGAAAVSVIASAAILHGFLRSRREIEAQQESLRLRNEALEASNRELAAREEEIARQNEEMQSQTEELERQSEELRAANDELLRRERTLETLLALSRALAAELTRGQAMAKVCEALSQLVDESASGAAVLEQVGEDMVVRCHAGFGPEGLAEDRVPVAQAFATLVMSRGRTAYIEDVTQRPDLRLPQPKAGPRAVSVLAVPLRVGGWPIGTLELYATSRTAWSEEQVALAESLAAQASVSLEAAQLFETVAQERQRLETVLRTVPFGIKVANADASEIRLNPAGAAIFGLPADANLAAAEVYGKVRMTESGKPVPPERFPVRRVLRERQDLRGEWELELPDGRRVNLLVHGSPIRTKDGAVIGAVAAFVDITVQKELQRELDARRREAEEASVRKTRFLAAVSHDIRTPANAISLLAELIRRTSANPALVGEVPELAREMHESAMALVNLLGDVLDVARFDSGKIDVQESDVSLGELLGEEYRRMQPLARDKGLTLDFAAPAEPIRVRADRIKLSRVVGNLLGNAIKFTPEGTVRLEARPNGDGWAEVRVIDTGVGIAPEHQRSIFDEFFQLSNPERDRNKGTGLGLAICKRLVDAMGGKLRVESTPGRGSTFTVSLPPAGGMGK